MINEMHLSHRGYTKNVMNRAQIELLLQIAETGSFTAAGEQLHMTQPAVSRTIASVEAQLGTKLIKRDKKKGLFFTEVGEQVLVILRRINSEFHKVDELIASEQGLAIGKVHVGVYKTAYTRFLPKIIRMMDERYPGLEVKLWEGTVDQIKQWLRTDCVDVGFITATDEEFDRFPFVSDEWVVVLPEHHRLAHQVSISLLDLAEESLLIEQMETKQQVQMLFQDQGLVPHVRYEMQHLETGLKMMEEGLGVVITTRQSIAGLSSESLIRQLETTETPDIKIAVRNKKEISKATEVFIETAQSLFAETVDRY